MLVNLNHLSHRRRKAEKNTLPIYPDLIPRNSVYCQKPPKNKKAGSPPATGTKLKQSDITSSSSTHAKSTPVDPNPKPANNAIRTSSVDEGEGNGSCDDAEEEK
ncbi:hypothetical protein PTTG_09510 [Puccinia triticina 1-1 BBBD Race 1]|uniref:Uncharacterized protein n=1 Tax=Puccinia triticina (isolate 1-1 / race 1 (BBBD)) TaxID=630390 RepID=A0A0C4F8L2_PUCT1|nr:hypothetical protein PTTG_09510 [Puccinia triticina 1-1 BBBD Race 1]